MKGGLKVPMKKKSKGKSSIQEFRCDICEMLFDGEPYASIDTPSVIKVRICSEPCWRVCLKGQQDLLGDLDDYIDEKLIDFVEDIAERADYEFVLDTIKETIQSIRSEVLENQARQLEQDAKQIS